jgi:hypothetical protein
VNYRLSSSKRPLGVCSRGAKLSSFIPILSSFLRACVCFVLFFFLFFFYVPKSLSFACLSGLFVLRESVFWANANKQVQASVHSRARLLSCRLFFWRSLTCVLSYSCLLAFLLFFFLISNSFVIAVIFVFVVVVVVVIRKHSCK